MTFAEIFHLFLAAFFRVKYCGIKTRTAGRKICFALNLKKGFFYFYCETAFDVSKRKKQQIEFEHKKTVNNAF
jgi:hypothetical protein